MSPHGNTIDSRVLLSLTPLPALFDNLVSVGLKFPLTRALHLREYSNGYHSALGYTYCFLEVRRIPDHILTFWPATVKPEARRFLSL